MKLLRTGSERARRGRSSPRPGAMAIPLGLMAALLIVAPSSAQTSRATRPIGEIEALLDSLAQLGSAAGAGQTPTESPARLQTRARRAPSANSPARGKKPGADSAIAGAGSDAPDSAIAPAAETAPPRSREPLATGEKPPTPAPRSPL